MEERPYDEIIDETCPDCRQSVPSGAKVCPNCGYRIRPEEVSEVKERPAAGHRPPRPAPAFSKAGFGGVLIILSGILAVVTGIYIAMEPSWVMDTISELGLTIDEGVVVASGILTVIFGIVAVAGGYFAIKRRRWGLAIIGGVLGILAGGGALLGSLFALIGLVLVAVSRREFT